MSTDVELLRRNYAELQVAHDLLRKEALKAVAPLANLTHREGLHGEEIVASGSRSDVRARDVYTAQAFIARWGR